MTENLNSEADPIAAYNAPKPKKKISTTRDMLSRMGVLGEMLSFFWKRKQFWLIPMMIILAIFAFIIVFGATTPAGLFIYTLF